MELDGRRALVTGGARRIGRAICLALAERGATVVIHCHRSRAEADEVAAACPGSRVVVADLAEPDAPVRVLAEAEAAGGLDILVNNASTYEAVGWEEVGAEQWDRTLAVNLRAPFFLARDAGRRMRDRGRGCIVNLTDWAVTRPYARHLPYFAAKAGLTAATRGLARALAPEVRVNAVAPGPVLPPDDASPEEQAAWARATPLGQPGGPEAVVQAVLYLLCNDFVTGEVLTVDGGRSLR